MRPSREQTYMEICRVLAKRSTCTRGQVGAVLVLDGRIVATGYNGSPPGAPHCTDVGCDVPREPGGAGCQRTLHAEANVIAFAARHGQAAEGSVLYCTHGPCLKCAQLIASAGIVTVCYEVPYRLPHGLQLLDELSIPTRQFAWTPEDPVLPALSPFDHIDQFGGKRPKVQWTNEAVVTLDDGTPVNLFQEATLAAKVTWPDGHQKILVYPRGYLLGKNDPPSEDEAIEFLEGQDGKIIRLA